MSGTIGMIFQNPHCLESDDENRKAEQEVNLPLYESDVLIRMDQVGLQIRKMLCVIHLYGIERGHGASVS